MLAAVVRKLVVGKDGAGNDVGRMRLTAGSSRTFHVERGILGRLLGSLPALARDDVGGVPADQWCFGAVGSYSPWCFSVSRRSSVSVATSRLLSPRPGSRVLISCSSQLLPSGSLNEANEL